MPISSAASGTQTAVVGTEHTLATLTTAKTYVLLIETANLGTSDTLELRAKTKVLSTSGLQVVYFDKFTGVQAVDDIIKMSIPVVSLFESAFTLKQTSGTGRSFEWQIIGLG